MKRSIRMGIILMSISIGSYALVDAAFFTDEDYCLGQAGVEQGYCNERIIGDGGDARTVKWCDIADMNAPNPTKKKKCAGNAMEPV